jgi:hypothetical protein
MPSARRLVSLGDRRFVVVGEPANARIFEINPDDRRAYEVDPGLIDDDRLIDDVVPDGELDSHELDSHELDQQNAETYPISTSGPSRSNARNPVTWGDRALLEFIGPGQSTTVTKQLLNFGMERPMICSVRFHATFVPPLLGNSQLLVLTLTMDTGVGRAKAAVRKTYWNQPTLNADLDVIFEDQPIQNLVAKVSAIGTGDPTLQIECTLAIAPTVWT